MSQASHQTSLGESARTTHGDSVVKLNDQDGTVLREGDVLANTRTGEKLTVLGYDEDVESVEYYSNYEREEGLHDTAFIPACFDVIFRTTDGSTKVITLSP